MLFLIAFVGAAIIALVLWKAMNASRSDAPPVARRPQSPGPEPTAGERPGRRPRLPASARREGQAARRPPDRPVARPSATGRRRRPRPPAPAGPCRVRGSSRSRSTSAPSCRCGSNGIRTTARHRPAKCSATRSRSTPPAERLHAVDHRDRVADQVAVPVRVEPVHGRRRAARAVDRAGRHHHDLVGHAEHAVHRRVHQAGAAVGEHHVVEVLEQVHRAPVVVFAERLGHRGILLAGEHLQPRRRPARCRRARRCSGAPAGRRAAGAGRWRWSPAGSSG